MGTDVARLQDRKQASIAGGNEGEHRRRGVRGGRPAYEEAGKAFVFYSLKYNGNMEGFNGRSDVTWLRLQKERSGCWVEGRLWQGERKGELLRGWCGGID